VRNLLFVMADQLRWDAIGCANGDLPFATPNIDDLAARGVRFDRAYTQGATCGSSRMSFYTGRYVTSHGARYNEIPLNLTEATLADHLRPLGVESYLIGKTHSVLDPFGAAALGLDPTGATAQIRADAGFKRVVRYDGVAAANSPDSGQTAYDDFLRSNGYDIANPWHDIANSGRRNDGSSASGWTMESGLWPAIVPDELSETAWTTDLAIDFMRDKGAAPWCLHLSYIKPHWPYVVSEPYHQLVDQSDLPVAKRSAHEVGGHPAMTAFQAMRISRNFSDDAKRAGVHCAYFGLIAQLDHHLGRLWGELERLGRSNDTMIVFTSDHGDYMGDHWMGEKDYLHDSAIRVPLIVVDPSAGADSTRGSAVNVPTECIDVLPTFVEAVGGEPDASLGGGWIEGQSLVPFLTGVGKRTGSDQVAVSETDYGFREMRDALPELEAPLLRARSITTERWKYIEHDLFGPQLFDLDNDPDELIDLGQHSGYAAVRSDLTDGLHQWRNSLKLDPRTPAHRFARPGLGAVAARGFPIGFWDEAEIQTAKDARDLLR
ncbi:MAG: sulfatase-like hydrolase/transferase, partial [Actinobacteria bacterium]|nr:sulfatase-like hydrolase/transferase [Actinomycetota bacterium]